MSLAFRDEPLLPLVSGAARKTWRSAEEAWQTGSPPLRARLRLRGAPRARRADPPRRLEVPRVLEAEGAAVLLLDPERDELYFPYVAEEDPEVGARLAALRFPADRGL